MTTTYDYINFICIKYNFTLATLDTKYGEWYLVNGKKVLWCEPEFKCADKELEAILNIPCPEFE
jgi:hypothetical protein